MWLDKLKELKTMKGLSAKQIAEATNLPERTVKRIFSGDTDNPYVDTLHRIVTVLGGSLDDILTDTRAVVGDAGLVALQESVASLVAERDSLATENAELKAQVTSLSAKLDMLEMQVQHKDEIIALHIYYNKLRSGN